jgi:DNA-directed RNA polymerase specialized sigma24 family protein
LPFDSGEAGHGHRPDVPAPRGPSLPRRREWTLQSGRRVLRDHEREALCAREKLPPARDLIERLEAEWPVLASGPLLPRLRVWSQREAALAGFATPQHLLRHLRGLRGRPRAEDEILAALVRQAQTDPLAARVVLQALLPGLKALAGRILLDAGERDELWSALLAHCWERIRHYPLERRPARIAANTLLDTLKKTTRELKRQRRDRDQFTPESPTEPAALDSVDNDVEQLLRRAVAAAAISADEAELIVQTRIDGVDLHALADMAGLAYNTLVVRRLRAEKRLLLFLGQPAVTFGGRKRPLCSARVVGAGLTGSAGRGAATDLRRRR